MITSVSRCVFFKIGLIGFLLWTCFPESSAQLYPGLSGEDLADAIRHDYTPNELLNDTEVKDTLYARIFAVQDTVHCIYSGLPRYLPDGVDPSQWLYGSGTETESINLEHAWPQAKGAGEGKDGNTNMYHLFPSRSGINSDRANFPFSEINDQQTQKWYFKNVEMGSKPVSNIGVYSEFFPGRFEPREEVKGDIARAMFYFWTIYRDDALEADPSFFSLQLDDLCMWHELDPISAEEILRNNLIAAYQDGKHNPFILDCSLVGRAYCSQLEACETMEVGAPESTSYKLAYIIENQYLIIIGEEDRVWETQLFDLSGRPVWDFVLRTNQLCPLNQLSSGIYIAQAVSGSIVTLSKVYIP